MMKERTRQINIEEGNVVCRLMTDILLNTFSDESLARAEKGDDTSLKNDQLKCSLVRLSSWAALKRSQKSLEDSCKVEKMRRCVGKSPRKPKALCCDTLEVGGALEGRP